jgi:hypothetical protein
MVAVIGQGMLLNGSEKIQSVVQFLELQEGSFSFRARFYKQPVSVVSYHVQVDDLKGFFQRDNRVLCIIG